MTSPFEKEEPMQILGRIGPMVRVKSGDLNFGLKRPQRTDMISSGPPFWGVPNNFYFMNFFDPRPHSAQNGHLSVLGIKWAPLLGTPITFFTRLWPPPLKKRSPCKIWEGSVQRCGCGCVSRTHAHPPTHPPKHTHTHTHSILVYRYVPHIIFFN